MTNKATHMIGDSITVWSGTSDIQNVYHAMPGRTVGAPLLYSRRNSCTKAGVFEYSV